MKHNAPLHAMSNVLTRKRNETRQTKKKGVVNISH